MMTAFHLLEDKLMREIYNMRLVLSHILNPQFNHVQHNQFLNPAVNLLPTLYHNIINAAPKHAAVPVTGSPIDHNVSTTTATPPIIANGLTEQHIEMPPSMERGTDGSTIKSTPNVSPLLKSLPSLRRTSGPRDFEIYKFNNTILSGNEIQVFTYFWKIENYTANMRSPNRTEVHSPVFVIAGFNLRIRASLNHLHRDFLYVHLDQLSNELAQKSGASSITLETGNLFKEIVEEPTKKQFRHKIVILDQTETKNDLISQEFQDAASGFMIPNSALATVPYSKDGCLLIKVIIYL